MAGYSGTPLWKKLGYKTGDDVFVEGGPPEYKALLGLPAGTAVKWLTTPKSGMKLVHLFAVSAPELKTKLKTYRTEIAPDGAIWVSWPKKNSGAPTNMNEDVIRKAALPLGLVDVKVCAIDEVWSGLKLMIRKELR